MDTATQVEPIPNQFPSPIIGAVSATDPRIRPADQSPSHELIIGEEDMLSKLRMLKLDKLLLMTSYDNQ